MKSKFTWIFTLLLAFFIQFSFAQEKTITGVVTDGSGMPVPGASVSVAGGQGVQTDFDGNFSIKASVGQKITIQLIGMKPQTITVGTSNVVNVVLEDEVTQLEDVVVQAFRTTTARKSNVAATTITSATIEGRPNASFIQTLQAQVPGLNITTGSGQPGANSQVILRGIGSINGNIEPLFVIDGVPLNIDNFRSINPNDIESVSVLKDAGATSIYGNRGANGVIVVKTKRGSFEGKTDIRYTSITSFTTLQDNKYNMMNSRQLLALENARGIGMGSTMTPEEIAAYNVNTDWSDRFFRTGVTHNHVLSLNSGGKNLSSFTSLGYFDQEGILINTDLKRFNFRNNLNGKSNDGKFSYGSNVTINYSQRHEADLRAGAINQNFIIGAFSAAPYIDPALYTGSQDLFDLYQTDGTLLYTPLMLMDKSKTFTNRIEELKMIGSVSGSYDITEDLMIGANLGIDYTQATGSVFQDPISFNSFVQRQTGQEFTGYADQTFSRDFNMNSNVQLTYTKTFAEDHTIEASAFTEYFKAHFQNFNFRQTGLDPKTSSLGDGSGYIGFDGTPFYVPGVGAGKGSAGLFSYFGSLDYDYKSTFGFGATVRRDASYRFMGDNRWGTFWSVSGRWNIDSAEFMKGSTFNALKLRASYGTAGNQNIVGQSIYNIPNGTRELYVAGTGYANLPSYVVTQLANRDLRWETITQANIGLDFELLDHRLRGSLDVYDKRTSDLYLSIPISGVNATPSIDANYGDLQNRGVEAIFAYDVFRNTDGFNLTLKFNGSYNKNKVLDIFSNPGEVGMIDNGLSVVREGHLLNEFYLVKYAGINPANGNLLFLDRNGVPTENPDPVADRRYTGKSSFPVYQGGFGFDASYKGFFLTSQFSFVADVWRFDYDLLGAQQYTDIGTFNKSTDVLRAWTPDNRVTDMPAYDATNITRQGDSDRYLKDASYTRLRYVSLGYDFSKKMLEKSPFSGIKAYVQAENLVTWSKWRGFDAESPRGNDQDQYPTPKIVSIGLELSF